VDDDGGGAAVSEAGGPSEPSGGPPSDAELLARSSDDSSAFAELYDRHATAVLAYFVRRTGCAQTSADLMAETFAAAFASRRLFRDVGAPGRAWLFTIAARQLSRFVRTQRVETRARRKLGVAPVALDPVDHDRVEALADLAPLRSQLARAVEGLPPGQADAVRLRIADDLPFAEVARRLGCSEVAARVRVSRALTTLADRLEEP
jgi:RNA polymerase sigma-70 factor, ECF subfamily